MTSMAESDPPPISNTETAGMQPDDAQTTPPTAVSRSGVLGDSLRFREYYEKYWEHPEEYNDPTTPERMALLRKHLAKLPEGANIIDVGCGRGEFCQFFKEELHLHPRGIDVSEAAIRYATQQYPGIQFDALEAQELLSEHARTFDCVFSSEVIEHLFDVGCYLDAVQALLKPDGVFVLTTPFHGLIKNLAIDFFGYASHYDPLEQHIRFFNRQSLTRCLEASGLTPVTWTGYGRPWPFWKSFFVVCHQSNQNH